MVRKGDTLVEVTIAIGIFSMIAIAVASVMNSSTSDAQLALETTLAREEIDAQAEALRFIHDSYASNKNESENKISELWKKIISNVVYDSEKMSNEEKEAVLQYAPLSCDANTLFGNNTISERAFVLDPTKLEDGVGAYFGHDELINNGRFLTPLTYPRLVYTNPGGEEGGLYNDDRNGDISSVEGLYVIGVAPASAVDTEYYDFYVRTCWYGGGSKEPSTIATVLRLYNSDKQSSRIRPFDATVTLLDWSTSFNEVDGLSFADLERMYEKAKGEKPTKDGYELVGWCDKYVAKPGDSCPSDANEFKTYDIFRSYEKNQDYHFYAVWRPHYWIDVNVYVDEITPNDTSGRPGFEFEPYINNRLIKVGERGRSNMYDFYREIPDGDRVKFVFRKVAGYYMSNTSTICGKIPGCTVKDNPNDYTVEFVVNPDYLSVKKDSSGHYAIQIEPLWLKKK